MSNDIYILDQDEMFSSMLNNIFQQAGYASFIVPEANRSIDFFNDRSASLIVTNRDTSLAIDDQFVQRMRSLQPNSKIIIVSEDLDAPAIRDLISWRVDGVFSKPLNIISFLKHVSQLLVEEDTPDDVSDSSVGIKVPGIAASLASAPCKCPESIAYAKKLNEAKDFTRALVLCGSPGAQFELACEDLDALTKDENSEFITLEAAHVTIDSIRAALTCTIALQKTLVFNNAESIPESIADFLKKEWGARSKDSSGQSEIRYIFCVESNIDDLFDEGIISESLYLLMGSVELTIPSLGNCVKDIATMAQGILTRLSSGRKKMDSLAGFYLANQSWPENYRQLKRAILLTLKSFPDCDILTRGHFELTIHQLTNPSSAPVLQDQLRAYRSDYINAMHQALNGSEKWVNYLDVDKQLLEQDLVVSPGDIS